MHIHGERITLRAIERTDLEMIRSWYNDPGIAGGLGDMKWPTSQAEQEAHFERTKSSDSTARLMVELKDGTPIGLTGFWGIHWRDRRAEHALVIGDSTQHGKGLGQEIIRTCANYAFAHMDLYRLDAMILANNEASLKAYTSCGFVVEGTLRQHALRDGKRIDRHCLGLLREDFKK